MSFTELPIKLEPDDTEPEFQLHIDESFLKKKSSSSSDSSDSTRHRSKPDHRQSTSSNGHSSKEDKKSKRNENKTSETKTHHKSHHSRTSHSDSSSSKRKHEENSPESKENDTSQKKPKLEHEEKRKDSSSTKQSQKSNNNSSSSSGNNHHSKTSSKHKESSSSSSSSKPKDKSSTKKKHETNEAAEEVDFSEGLGFAEALAFFDMPSTSKKKDLQLADKITKVKSKSPSKSSRDDKRSSASGSEEKRKSLKALTAPPRLLTQKPKLEPLPDIVSDLPSDVSIPDYRPMPLNAAVKEYINSSVLGSASSYLSRPPSKNMSASDLLVQSFSSKANRTRVYSGNRVARSVPPLFEMCIRVLQENIEFLETTGGVPFDILRPVLDRAKPEQLSVIEYYNPYLLDESDVLWEPHCKRKFRTKQRLEMETWRDMYDRCTREDEEKLSRLTQNIKQHQETTSNGVQKTMLAFVDSMVKPPRNIMRKQEIFGTNRKLVVSPAARTVGLRHMAPNLAAAGDARLRVAAGLRDDAQHGEEFVDVLVLRGF